MQRSTLALLGLVCTLSLSAQTLSQKASVLVSATVSASPATITLNWSSFSGSTGFTISRKLKSATSWTQIGTAGGGATQFVDNNVTVGEYYEYKVDRSASAGSGSALVRSCAAPRNPPNGFLISCARPRTRSRAAICCAC